MLANDTKIDLINTLDSVVQINLRDPLLNRRWDRKGVVRQVEWGVLKEAFYDTGVQNMITMGALYIPNMEAKIALGLEPPEATEPVNIIVLDDTEKRRYLTVMTFKEFEEAVSKLGVEEVRNLADYAIENNLMDIDKDSLIKKITGTDVIKAITLNKADREG